METKIDFLSEEDCSTELELTFDELVNVICNGEEFALLRETLQIYNEIKESSGIVH